MKHTLFLCRMALLLLLPAITLSAQDSLRYYRLYLKDKGTPARVLRSSDPFYDQAIANLTPRAMARRAKVLPPGELVSTDDLPIHPPYLSSITATGATVAQTSRWLNTVMVIADSATYERLRTLPFLDSVRTMGTRGAGSPAPFDKRLVLGPGPLSTDELPPNEILHCLNDAYGNASWGNRMMGMDRAHELGIAGEGVLIGVLDAGFDWRGHAALRNLQVIGEWDFVYNDPNVFDENGESGAESHGTAVMSIIGGYQPGVLVGGAPQASFLLAKTEDIRSERHVEEDNFVAGLEWLEAQGVDLTNTSLGYSEFDAPERRHEYSELNGRTAHASRGLNHAVRLGVICVVAAGNEAGRYNYVSVPAEADSAIAVAAVDSVGRVAGFSSRGFSGRIRVKPDVAGFGVGNWAADYSDTFRLTRGQGTSYASPMVTASVAILLSARPWLTPYEIRELLYRTSRRAANPDTAVGYGLVDVARALDELSRSAPIVGKPKISFRAGRVSVAAGTLYRGGIQMAEQRTNPLPTNYLTLQARILGSLPDTLITVQQPLSGIARWYLPNTIGGISLRNRDTLELTFRFLADNSVIRRDTFVVNDGGLMVASLGEVDLTESTLCEGAHIPSPTTLSTASPNPFRHYSIIEFATEQPADVSLTVYNTLGEEVARLIEPARLDAGFHTSYFSPAGLPAGAYYYTLRVDDAVHSDQMIYVR